MGCRQNGGAMRKKLQVKPLPKNRKVSGPHEPVAINYKLVALNAKNCRIGQDHHNATLSDHEVDLVVALHEEGMTYVVLAEKFGGEVLGYDIRTEAEKIRVHVGYMTQRFSLYQDLSVRENLAFGLKLRKTEPAEIEKRVKHASAMLGLDKLLDRLPKALSGGQRQRVAIGRAIVREPEVFLFDEPLSNLDAKLRVAMRTEIKELHQRLKTTSVYVTHDQIEAMTMADRIAIMNEGVLHQVDAPQAVYARPANLFVAQFMQEF